jgi:hypothetical protein
MPASENSTTAPSKQREGSARTRASTLPRTPRALVRHVYVLPPAASERREARGSLFGSPAALAAHSQRDGAVALAHRTGSNIGIFEQSYYTALWTRRARSRESYSGSHTWLQAGQRNPTG